MTKIKICGLTREIDIQYVNELAPDYVGFVFAKSKRQVSLEQAEKLVRKLSSNIKTVGVFVNEDLVKVQQIAETLNLDIIQLHGSEDIDYMEKLRGFQLWKAIGINSYEDLKLLQYYKDSTVLLDSKIAGSTGGTGVTFDWDMIKQLGLQRNIILAGGINSNNVVEAIDKVKPFAVDISSGVETDGFKDYNKIQRFIKAVRQTNY